MPEIVGGALPRCQLAMMRSDEPSSPQRRAIILSPIASSSLTSAWTRWEGQPGGLFPSDESANDVAHLASELA